MSFGGLRLWLIRLLPAGFIVFGVFGLTAGGAEQRPPPSAVTPFPPQGASRPAKQGQQPVNITVKDGRLTGEVQSRPIEAVLEEISRLGKVAIIRSEGVGGQRISFQFQDLPLDEGLRQILKDHDAFFFFGVEKEKEKEEAPASLRAVWVYPKGRGRGLAPLPPEAWASTKELEAKLADPDPEGRARAVEGLVERKGDKALDAVLQALGDGDEEVRARALYGALNTGVKLPPDALNGLALSDPSANVRFLALQSLASDPNVRSIAEQALSDPSAHVRNKAQEILWRLDQASTPPEPRQPSQGQPRPWRR